MFNTRKRIFFTRSLCKIIAKDAIHSKSNKRSLFTLKICFVVAILKTCTSFNLRSFACIWWFSPAAIRHYLLRSVLCFNHRTNEYLLLIWSAHEITISSFIHCSGLSFYYFNHLTFLWHHLSNLKFNLFISSNHYHIQFNKCI